VREQWLCDSTFDCADGSDEDPCPITPVYECPNDADTAYVALDRCDQFVSCGTDAADELGCACLPAP
jgi:hypothetical protein